MEFKDKYISNKEWDGKPTEKIIIQDEFYAIGEMIQKLIYELGRKI